MKLLEALSINNRAIDPSIGDLKISLICGFELLHLRTFLLAHLRAHFGNAKIVFDTGIYGDLLGNLNRMLPHDHDTAVVIIEWSDIDPRLGLRTTGGWTPDTVKDIVASSERQLSRMEVLLQSGAKNNSIIATLPTLPLPLVFLQGGDQTGEEEARLLNLVSTMRLRLACNANIRLVSEEALGQLSARGDRLDVRAELTTGFPYTLSHASSLANIISGLIYSRDPKKGIITDLDDTLWRGILGEVGVNGVSWDIDNQSQIHALYQQLLNALAESGVLVAVVSKNDPDLVEKAFRRKDILLPRSALFPLEANWLPKSKSVGRVLNTWNVGEESVVFVDDTPLELDEVKFNYKCIETLRFPVGDDDACYSLFKQIRGVFGKDKLTAEDLIRSSSLKVNRLFKDSAEEEIDLQDNFLEGTNALVEFDFRKNLNDMRAFDLINKTNQFNLNGARFQKSQWDTALGNDKTFQITVSYSDKYGHLGKIAVIIGHAESGTISVSSWCMSCRAFGRRIEHRCLETLFRFFEVDRIRFNFSPTGRNRPLTSFFSEFLDLEPLGEFELSQEIFLDQCPLLFHTVEVHN